MEADGSTCPEGINSTDCLLRTLLQLVNNNRKADDAETDWDPATFGLTLVIGVIAAVFAAIPIIQTVITTGKSGRKANERAIGIWSKKTKKHWSWSTMSFEFTARTPVLQAATLSTWLKEMTRESAGKGPAEPQKNQSQRQDEFAASWLGFFKHTGLEMVIPTNDDNLRAVAVEYLPGDLLAAPAYAELGVIVSAAATAGIQSLNVDKSTGYPTLLGHGFQFDFRQHPVLGMVGAYSRYGPIPETSTNPTPEILQQSMHYMRGYVECEAVDDIDGVYAIHLSLVEAGEWTWELVRDYSWYSIKYHDCFLPGHGGYLRGNQTVYVPIVITFTARRPKKAPPLFPISNLNEDIPLTLLALNGSYWSDTNLDGFGEIDLPQERPSWAFWDGTVPGNFDSTSIPFLEKYMRSISMKATYVGSSTDLTGYTLLLKMSLMLLHDTKTIDVWFQKRSSQRQAFLRSMILAQIEEVDRWLGLQGHLSRYRTIVLCNTSILLHNSTKMIKVPQTESSHWTEDCQTDKTDGKSQKHQNTARKRHYDILLALGDLLKEFSLSPELTEAISKFDIRSETSTAELPAEFVEAVKKNSKRLSLVTDERGNYARRTPIAIAYRMLLRLSAIVYRSDPNYEWLDWRELYKSVEPETTDQDLEKAKDLDDVIIYRCLLINLLFRTALDPTELLQSGLWEQVIPII